MPQTPLQSHDDWDRTVGAIWTRLLTSNGLAPDAHVAEVGPGFTLKVEYGLKELGFRGTLYIVEPNPRIADWIVCNYRQLLPAARIIPVRARIHSAAAHLPNRLDALLMNHLLDDLVLDAATPARRRAGIFGNMRPGALCSPHVRRAWRVLAAHPARLEIVSRTVADDIASMTAPLLHRIAQRRNHRRAGLFDQPRWLVIRETASTC